MPSKHLSWWRRPQGVLIKTNILVLVIHLQNTSSRRLQDVLIKMNIFTLVMRFPDVFKMFSRGLFKDILKVPCQDVYKTSCEDVFKGFSRRFQDIFTRFSRPLQHLSSSLRRLKDAFNTLLRCTAMTIIYRKICLGHTSEKFMVRV